jgi:hypothetical protein
MGRNRTATECGHHIRLSLFYFELTSLKVEMDLPFLRVNIFDCC